MTHDSHRIIGERIDEVLVVWDIDHPDTQPARAVDGRFEVDLPYAVWERVRVLSPEEQASDEELNAFFDDVKNFFLGVGKRTDGVAIEDSVLIELNPEPEEG